MSSYQTIPVVHSDGEVAKEVQDASRLSGRRWKLGLAAALVGTVILAMAMMGYGSGSSTQADMLLGASHHTTARACTFDECVASTCNQKLAPFTCLFHNGGPHGGCSATPWTLETCDEGCDLSGCADLDIPDDAPDCDEPCTEDFCNLGRLCGPEVPYQCTSGASTFGCSADKYMWTLRVAKTSCGSCCNIKYC
jgi:hypothetical protein